MLDYDVFCDLSLGGAIFVKLVEMIGFVETSIGVITALSTLKNLFFEGFGNAFNLSSSTAT